MTPKKRLKALMKAAEDLQQRLGLEGLVILATSSSPEGTESFNAVAGNRFAAIGVAEAWLRNSHAYDEGFKAEAGRYDAVVMRQKENKNRPPDD